MVGGAVCLSSNNVRFGHLRILGEVAVTIAMGACCRGMADDSDHYEDVDVVISMLKAVYCRDGADVAVQAAKHMIAAAAALVTCENGPDETRRILRIVGEAQGKTS